MTKFWTNPIAATRSALVNVVRRSTGTHWFLTGADGPDRGQVTSIGRPYAQSSWVHAALDTIAMPLRSAPVRLRDGEGVPIVEDWLRAWWKMPGTGVHEPLSMGDMVTWSVLLRGVAGGVFWVMDNSWLQRTPRLYNRIRVAAPSQMTPLWDGRRLDGWAYRDGAGRYMALDCAQVFHLRHANPDDPNSLDGVAPWMAIRASAEAARAGQIYARRTMDQNGDRGKLIISRYALTREQKALLRAELQEKRRAAERGEYRDSVIGGDFTVHESPMAAVSSDFAAQMSATRDEIYVAYGVPASMASQTASYSVGAASDWYRLITGTCASEGMVLAEAIARVSEYLLGWRTLGDAVAGRVSHGERSVVAEFDFSSHPVMADVRASRVEQLERLWRIGVPVSVGNEFLDLGLAEYAGWDESRLSSGVRSVAGSVTRADEGDGEDVRALVMAWGRSRMLATRAAEAEAEAARSAEREAWWQRVDAAREVDRRRMRRVISRHLMEARAETLRNLRGLADGGQDGAGKALAGPYAVRAGVIDIVFDFGRWFGGLWKDVGRVVSDIFVTASEGAGEEAATVLGEDVGEFDPMTETDPKVIDELRRRENMVRGAAESVHADVTATLEEGLEAGASMDELAARVKVVFNQAGKQRAEVIARTETGAAYETARYWTFKRAGITQKGWLSGGDDGHTRATHIAADGQVREMDDFFDVGAAHLLHPHDHVHGADYPGELINCRCVLTAEA